MEKRSEYALLSDKGNCPVLLTILISIAVGAVLSVINYFISGKETE